MRSLTAGYSVGSGQSMGEYAATMNGGTWSNSGFQSGMTISSRGEILGELGIKYGVPAAPGTGLNEYQLELIVKNNVEKINTIKEPLFRVINFYFRVRKGGEWDYKRNTMAFENFGNYNYGYVGASIGVPRTILLAQAGAAQKRDGHPPSDWGSPGLLGLGYWGASDSYGDDPRDQLMINHGIYDFWNGY